MKLARISSFRAVCAAGFLTLSLAAGGCNTVGNTADRQPIPLAPVGAASPGIGSPGGGSADTRATGTVAAGQGGTPYGTTTPATAPIAGSVIAPAGPRGH